MDKDTATLLLGAAALLVSSSVGLVAYSQMRIASAKTKLDLYNKRFAIYVSALDFYQALWNEPDAVLKISAATTRAYRESQFLFDRADGVYETFGKLHQHGFKAKYHHDQIKQIESPPHGRTGDAAYDRQAKSTSLTAYEKELRVLETRIAKYLSFTGVSGWAMTGFLEGKPASLKIENQAQREN